MPTTLPLKKPVRVKARYRVPSFSNRSNFYWVTVFGDGRLSCECRAGSMGKNCKHKKMIENWVENKEYSYA